MNLRDLDYLVTLADLRHFSKAAETCHVSQPTLSTQIRKLEAELDVQLFERAPRKVMLTPIGEEIVELARKILRDTDQLRLHAKKRRNPASGILKLGLFPTLAPYLLPHVVPRIRKHFPELSLQLFEEKTADILRMLQQGKLDAGILALPLPDNTLQHHVLFEEPFVLAVPSEHPLAKKRNIKTDDLRSTKLLLLEEGHCLRDHALEVCQMAGALEELDFHATSMETLRQMVAANAGITLMPTLSVKPPIAQAENVVVRTFAPPVPKRVIAMCWRKSTVNEAFMHEFAELFAQLDPKLLTPENTKAKAA